MAGLSVEGQALLAHLDGGTTTVCRCWKLVRKDGQILGFTDHDEDLEFDDTRFSAASGFTAAALEQTTGLAVDNSEAAGALSAATITKDDVEAGRYDGAVVTSWLVNWNDLEQRLIQFNGSFGEVTRCGDAFRTELRGITESLNQPQGRVYQSMCPSILGDNDCRFALETPGYSLETVVVATAGETFLTVPDTGQEEGWFARGRLLVLDGEARGIPALVKRDRASGSTREIELWESIRKPISAGDHVRLEAGCDKRAATCKEKFQNFMNFRGFPHVPGEDWLTAYPRQGDNNDGGSLNA